MGKRMRCRSSLSKPHRKASGFMACYYRYCALLRKAYHGKATKRCYFLLREDFKKFNRYQQQTHLLWEHRLQTLAEVFCTGKSKSRNAPRGRNRSKS